MLVKRISSKLTLDERIVTSFIFVLLLAAIGFDLSQDDWQALSISEIGIEMVIVLLACLGFAFLWFRLEKESEKSKVSEKSFAQLNEEMERWKIQSAQFVLEFQTLIDSHFALWGLTPSEKDVAMFLLKGLNFKEIADIRGSSTNTVRNQAHIVYEKSELTGRNDLAAYFMEELFQK